MDQLYLGCVHSVKLIIRILLQKLELLEWFWKPFLRELTAFFRVDI